MLSQSDEIVYMTVEDLMNEKITDRLRAAGSRGVDIRLAETSGDGGLARRDGSLGIRSGQRLVIVLRNMFTWELDAACDDV